MRWPLVLLSLVSAWGSRAAAWALRNDDLVFGRWGLSDAQLPFLLRFSLDGAVSVGLVVGTLLLVLLAKLRPIVVAIGFGGAALTLGGIAQARSSAAFSPAPLHVRCDCPEPRGALECHCAADGVVVVRMLDGRELPQIAGRLGAPLVIRETFSREGLTYSAEHGHATVTCAFDEPCVHRSTCGRCQLREPRAFSPLPEVHCVDEQPGVGALTGFVQLHRTVWEAESDSTIALEHLDEANALHTERSEIIGNEVALREAGDAVFTEIVFGKRPLGRRGVRACVVPTGRSFKLTEGFDPPLKTRWAIVRLEAVE